VKAARKVTPIIDWPSVGYAFNVGDLVWPTAHANADTNGLTTTFTLIKADGTEIPVTGASFACPWTETTEAMTLRAVMRESDGYESGRTETLFTVTNRKTLSVWYPSPGTALKVSTSYNVSWEARLANYQTTTALTWERSADGATWEKISLSQGGSVKTGSTAGKLYLRASWDDGSGHVATATVTYEVRK